ncbi:hypothetical protein [Pseudomonas sp. SLFW]|uniref:hypothetical protein n=1 Tax=Pseudomonas sp. SLFW TaxID=2683259 RepID=UPI001411BBC7|nr:hypothetical protein [Pseudomonas sp. SLFW]NBB11808.1 hypothetical protein [Pseudomonas sp. SLFW]
MATSNVDRFDRLTGEIFAKLFQSFPMPIDLDYYDYTEIIAPDPIHTPEGEVQVVEGQEFFQASVKWLVDSGYLSLGRQVLSSTKIQQCVLTAQALAALKAVPDSLTGKSIGSQLQEAARGGMIDSVKSLTGKALGIGVGMGYTAFTNWASS